MSSKESYEIANMHDILAYLLLSIMCILCGIGIRLNDKIALLFIEWGFYLGGFFIVFLAIQAIKFRKVKE